MGTMLATSQGGVLWTGSEEAHALGLSESVVSRRRTLPGHPANGPHRHVVHVGSRSHVHAPAADVIAWWLVEVSRQPPGRRFPAETAARIRAVAAEHGITTPETAPQETP